MENTTMTPAARGELALANFKQGYNCAQAVFLAFGDVTGLDPTTATRLVSSFGGGMGRMREVCGAVSGALTVLGLLRGYDRPDDREGKSRHYAQVRAFAERFKEKTGGGSILCRDLLAGARADATPGGEPEARSEAYYQKRPCGELCAIAAEIVEEMLAEQLPVGHN